MRVKRLINHRLRLNRISGDFIITATPFLTGLEFSKLIEIGYGLRRSDGIMKAVLAKKRKNIFTIRNEKIILS